MLITNDVSVAVAHRYPYARFSSFDDEEAEIPASSYHGILRLWNPMAEEPFAKVEFVG